MKNTAQNATYTYKAVKEFIEHITEVDADGIFDFAITHLQWDDNGNLWFHIRGQSNSDGSVYNDANLYQAKPSGVINSYEPKDDSYWNTDWACDPIDFLENAKLRNRYFEKSKPCARFNKECGELTSRYIDPLWGKPVSFRNIWDKNEDNPFLCTIAGDIGQYCE